MKDRITGDPDKLVQQFQIDNEAVAPDLEASAATVYSSDTDGDGITDTVSVDYDGDGRIDSSTTAADVDGDGIADVFSSDVDGDGVTDATMAFTDSDGDGVADTMVADFDGDGVADMTMAMSDTDGDGIADQFTMDYDGDGVADEMTELVDSDGDGMVDTMITDSDMDGFADSSMMFEDIDGDGLVDQVSVFEDGVGGDGVLSAIGDSENSGNLLEDLFDACFAGDMRVKTRDGDVPIRDIRKGMAVLSFDSETGSFFWQPVTHVRRHSPRRIHQLTLDNGATVRCTARHRVLTAKGWKRIASLEPGDSVNSTGGGVRVERIQITAQREPVFNIYCQGEKNFVVEGIVAHSYSRFPRIRSLLSSATADRSYASTVTSPIRGS